MVRIRAPMTSTRRWITVAVALVGAALAALSVQVGAWWQVDPGILIGPRGSRHCFDGECRRGTLGWLRGSSTWELAGTLAFASALVLAAILVFTAGALAARRHPHQVARSTWVAITLCLVSGAGFFLAFPGLAGAHAAWGPLALVGAITCAAVTATSILRAPPPPAAAA